MFDLDQILRDPKYRKEQLQLEAAWRFQLVAPLLGNQLSGSAKTRLRKQLVTGKVEHPFRGPITISARTLRRWCKIYHDQKLMGLYHRPRADRGHRRSVPAEAFETAKALFAEDPRRSVPALIRLLKVLNPVWGKIKRTTLGRHLRAAGLRRQATPEIAFRSFEAKAGNVRWQGDVLHGPKVRVEGKLVTAKVVSWIDDHSRFVVHLEAFDNERLPVLEHTLTGAIVKYGRPESVLVDNGKIYSGTGFTLACSQLGIRKIHSSPYHPQSKGKQERFFRTLREQFLNEVENVEPLELPKLNRLMNAWLATYHAAKHSETEKTPQERYEGTEPSPVTRKQLEEAFLQWAKRKVTTLGQISFSGQIYHVDPSLAGSEILVRYNPFDLSRIILWRDGAKHSEATVENLLLPQLERRSKKADAEHSTAAQKFLEDLEQTHQRQLAHELNLLHLEDETDE